MPITKKTLLPTNLQSYPVLIEDTATTSEYFRITRLPSQFTGGRNSFLIAGTNLLIPASQILIEILDIRGNPIFQTVVPNYIESAGRMVSVEIYDTTPPGTATLRIVGKARRTKEGRSIPLEWQNKFNVRWTSRIAVDYNINNTSPIRFARTPQVTVAENRFYNINSSSYATYNVPFTGSLLPTIASPVQVGYCLHLIEPSTFLPEYGNGIITGSLKVGTGSVVDVKLPIRKILNNKVAFTKKTLISSSINDGIVKKIYLRSGSYTASLDGIKYDVTSSALLRYSKILTSSTNIPISFANITVTDLTTVSGEVYKLKVYNKVATNTGNYKLVADVPLLTNEILVSSSIRGNVPIAIAENYTDNWYAGKLAQNTTILKNLYPVSGTLTYYKPSETSNQFAVSSSSDILLNAIYAGVLVNLSTNKFDGQVSASGYFLGTKEAYRLFNGSEYTLTLDATYNQTSGSITIQGNTPKVDIYLVGIGNTRILGLDPLGQKIGEITVSGISNLFDKKQFNFTPNVPESIGFGDIGLRFVMSNGFWNFSNVSIKPASDPQFSPDEVRILVPNTDYHNKELRYRIEFVDINNNSVDIRATSTPVFFTGSGIDLGTIP